MQSKKQRILLQFWQFLWGGPRWNIFQPATDKPLPCSNACQPLEQSCHCSYLLCSSLQVDFVSSQVAIYLVRNLFARFTHEQNRNIVGLSENARSKRKQRNMVTMKFNMINYLLETLSLILLLTVDDYFIGDVWAIFDIDNSAMEMEF